MPAALTPAAPFRSTHGLVLALTVFLALSALVNLVLALMVCLIVYFLLPGVVLKLPTAFLDYEDL